MALNISETIRAGDTLKFIDSLPDYPASTWLLKYTLVTDIYKISFEAEAQGDDHEFNVAMATTEKWKPGTYRYLATVTDGTDRFTVGIGKVEILADLEAGPNDERHHVEIVLDNIEALIENKATLDQKNYTVAGRSLERYSMDEILQLQKVYEGKLIKLKRKERRKAGKGSGRMVRVKL